MYRYGKLQKSVTMVLSINSNYWLSTSELVAKTGARKQTITRGLKLLICNGVVEVKKVKPGPLKGRLPKMFKLYRLTNAI